MQPSRKVRRIVLSKKPRIGFERFTSGQWRKFLLPRRSDIGDDISSYGWTMLYSKKLKPKYATLLFLLDLPASNKFRIMTGHGRSIKLR